MAAGDFSASQIPQVLTEVQNIFITGGRLNLRKNDPRLNTAKAVLENQTAVPLPVMTADGKCTAVDMTWLKYCGSTGVDCADEDYVFSCDITGAEGESVKERLEANYCHEEKFIVRDDECNDLFPAVKKIAEGIANAKLKAEANLSAFMMAQLYAGISPASAYEGEVPEGWDLDGTPYLYPGTAIDRPRVLSEMYVMSQINQVTNPVYVADGTWQADVYLAQHLNNNGGAVVNEAGLYDGMGNKWYFDPIAMSTLNNDAGRLIMFDPNNILAWFTNDVSNFEPEMWLSSKALTRWKEPTMYLRDRNGNPLYYDVYMQEDCIEGVNGKPRKVYKFKLTLSGGFHIGPNACNANDTGVYYFAKNTPTT